MQLNLSLRLAIWITFSRNSIQVARRVAGAYVDAALSSPDLGLQASDPNRESHFTVLAHPLAGGRNQDIREPRDHRLPTSDARDARPAPLPLSVTQSTQASPAGNVGRVGLRNVTALLRAS